MNLDKLCDATAFWQFSCELYARDGVKELCLQGQEDYGLNVNLVLLCHWLYQDHSGLDSKGFSNIKIEISGIESQVKTQRSKRKRLCKGEPEYQQCLALELQLEKQMQHEILFALQKQSITDSDEHCLAQYLAAEGVTAADWLQVILNHFASNK